MARVIKNKSAISGMANLAYLKNLKVVARIRADSIDKGVDLKRIPAIRYARRTTNDAKSIEGNLAANQFTPNTLNDAATNQ